MPTRALSGIHQAIFNTLRVDYFFTRPHLGFGYIVWTSWHNGTNNVRTPLYHELASSLRIPGFYHIQGIDCIKMADVNRKLLEKERVQNRFASYEYF